MPVLRTLFVLVLCISTGAAADKLQTLAGKEIQGDLVSIDTKNITIDTATGPIRVPVQTDVLHVDLQPVPPITNLAPCTQVELTDGSLLHCKPEGGFVIKGKQVQLTLLNDLKMELPITALSYVLKDAQNAKNRDNADWKRCLKERSTSDLVCLWKDDRLNGVEGTFDDKGDGLVLGFTLKSSGTHRADNTLDNKRAQGWIFVNKPDANAPVPFCKLLDVQQDVLLIAKVEFKAPNTFAVTTVSGAKLDITRDRVARLDFSKGRLEWLSDMKPTKIEMQPSEDRPDRYVYHEDAEKRNKNLEGSELRLGGTPYKHGMSLPAPTTLLYTLNGEYKEFSAVIGVDESVPGGSEARLVVEADGQKLFDEKIKRKDAPRTIRLNVKDRRELRIKVTSVKVLPYGERIDLADVKVNK